jgi:hypothetical protein
MKRLALALALALAALAASSCSSWDTGSDIGDGPRLACIDTIEAFARTAERCGADYKTSYDLFLRRDAAGDCRNVRSIRDEATLRSQCIPFVESLSCSDLGSGKSDPSCAKQLQRTTSVRF